MFNTHNLLTQKKGTRIRWQDRQAVCNGLGQGQVSGNGAEGDFAFGKMKLADRRWAKEKAHPISRSGPSTQHTGEQLNLPSH